MRSIKVLTVAGAAVLAIAFIASASASANTVLCTEAQTTCSPGSIMPAGTLLAGVTVPSYEGTSFALTGPVNGQCGTAVFSAKTNEKEGTPALHGEPGEFNLSNCAGSPCQMTATAGAATIEATGGGFGTVTLGSSEKHLSINMTNCYGLGINCKFGSAAVALHLEGEHLVAKEAVLSNELGSKGAICGGSIKMNWTSVAGVPLNSVFFSSS